MHRPPWRKQNILKILANVLEKFSKTEHFQCSGSNQKHTLAKHSLNIFLLSGSQGFGSTVIHYQATITSYRNIPLI